jgi:hypothetical protein
MAREYAVRINSANDNANPVLVTPVASSEGVSVVSSFGKNKEACELAFATHLTNTFVPVNPVTVYNFKGCEITCTAGAGCAITAGGCGFLDPNNPDPTQTSQHSNGAPFSDLDVKFGNHPLGIPKAFAQDGFIGGGSQSCLILEFEFGLYMIDIDDGLPGCP